VGTVADGDSMSTAEEEPAPLPPPSPWDETGSESRRCRWNRDADEGNDLCCTTTAAVARDLSDRPPQPRPAGTVDDELSLVHGGPSAKSIELGRGLRRPPPPPAAAAVWCGCCCRTLLPVCRIRNTSATEPSQNPRRYASSTRLVSLLTCCLRVDGRGCTTP